MHADEPPPRHSEFTWEQWLACLILVPGYPNEDLVAGRYHSAFCVALCAVFKVWVCNDSDKQARNRAGEDGLSDVGYFCFRCSVALCAVFKVWVCNDSDKQARNRAGEDDLSDVGYFCFRRSFVDERQEFAMCFLALHALLCCFLLFCISLQPCSVSGEKNFASLS